jgi:hypothetical protein
MVLSALAKLPDRQRMVLFMHCLHQLEQKQIADELGLTRGAVAASIFKARRKLEHTLGLKDTGLAALEQPGSSIASSKGDPGAGQAIIRRDPLAAVLAGVLSWLQPVASDNGSEWLDRIHRDAHARGQRSARPHQP